MLSAFDDVLTVSRAFCAQSRVRVEELFDKLWRNTDDVDRRLARRTLEGAYTFVEDGVLDPSEGTGPWIAHWEPGESAATSVARHYR